MSQRHERRHLQYANCINWINYSPPAAMIKNGHEHKKKTLNSAWERIWFWLNLSKTWQRANRIGDNVFITFHYLVFLFIQFKTIFTIIFIWEFVIGLAIAEGYVYFVRDMFSHHLCIFDSTIRSVIWHWTKKYLLKLLSYIAWFFEWFLRNFSQWKLIWIEFSLE